MIPAKSLLETTKETQTLPVPIKSTKGPTQRRETSRDAGRWRPFTSYFVFISETENIGVLEIFRPFSYGDYRQYSPKIITEKLCGAWKKLLFIQRRVS